MRNFIEQRQVLFQKMARIDQMEYGSLKAEYRLGADPEHPLGPYYKYQVWQDGKNRSERVADPRAEQLRKALEGRHSPRFAERYMPDSDGLDSYATGSYMFGGNWVLMNSLADL